MDRRTRHFDGGAIVFGVVILFVGGYYFLRNTLGWDIGELNWDLIWPALVIVLGGSVLYKALSRSRDEPEA